MIILPLSLLRWQINKISAGITELKQGLTDVDDELLRVPSFDMKYMKTTKILLFKLRRLHRLLHQRYVFAQELAANIERSFDKLKNRSDNLAEGIAIEYSETLKEALKTQMFNLETLKHDIKTAPKRIEAQYIMVRSYFHARMEQNLTLVKQRWTDRPVRLLREPQILQQKKHVEIQHR